VGIQSLRRTVGCGLAVIVAAALTLPHSVEAQVGLGSNVAQVTLVARIAPRASIQAVSPIRETGQQGSLKEGSVSVRGSTNAAYRLTVVRTAAPVGAESRVWVRAANGTFELLNPGSRVTVARGARSAGQWESEVQYRIESGSEQGFDELPVRYEVAVTPTI
jgi:hypothetical protein